MIALPELPVDVLFGLAVLGLVAVVWLWRCGPRGAAVGLGGALLALLALLRPRKRTPDLDAAFEREKRAADAKHAVETAAIEERHAEEVRAADARRDALRKQDPIARGNERIRRRLGGGTLVLLLALGAPARAEESCWPAGDLVHCTPAAHLALVEDAEDAERDAAVARAGERAAAAQRVADAAALSAKLGACEAALNAPREPISTWHVAAGAGLLVVGVVLGVVVAR